MLSNHLILCHSLFPSLGEVPQSHLINIIRVIFKALYQEEIPGILGTLCQMWEEDHIHISYYKSQYHSLSFLGGGNNANLMRIKIHFLFPESSFCSSSQKDRCWVHEVGIGPLVPWKVICQVGFDFFFSLQMLWLSRKGYTDSEPRRVGRIFEKTEFRGCEPLEEKEIITQSEVPCPSFPLWCLIWATWQALLFSIRIHSPIAKSEKDVFNLQP